MKRSIVVPTPGGNSQVIWSSVVWGGFSLENIRRFRDASFLFQVWTTASFVSPLSSCCPGAVSPVLSGPLLWRLASQVLFSASHGGGRQAEDLQERFVQVFGQVSSAPFCEEDA